MRVGVILHAERIERRRAYWTLEAIRDSASGMIPLKYRQAIEHSPDIALAKFNLDMARLHRMNGSHN